MSAPYTGPPAPQPGPFSGAPQTPQAQPKRSALPVVLLVIGAVILVGSIIIGAVVAVLSFRSTASGMDSIEVFDSGSGTYTAESGELVQAYVPEGAMIPSCSIAGPTPDAVGEGDSSRSSSTTIEGQTWSSFDSFTAQADGDYEIDCAGTPVALGPPVSIGGIFGTIGGIAVAVGGALLGGLLVLIGGIWLIVRRSKTS